MSQFKNLQLLALDVDGVLSDGRLYYTDQGEEFKSFNIRDGLGIKLLQRAGITVAIITGRTSAMVTRRAAELGIAHVVQGREDKLEALLDLCGNLKIDLSNVAYMGDDLPDRKAIMAVGLGATVADAASDVAAIADWQSRLPGGQGAVRELAEAWLRSLDLWDALIETV
ncbi:MAG: HAD-IIIA family hydrolase [Proteobacteria bacterium]|jgi:3-deoxy-D-manno-octulosonate 8-phosphate phosphatase (KDO 8-P phosphatase)|nr:HAD-IIIA family hydrolase [Pseudomonadota bacterium]